MVERSRTTGTASIKRSALKGRGSSLIPSTSRALAGRDDAMKKARESGEFGAQRVFVGKDSDKTAAVTLFDAKGKPRIKLSVDAAGTGRLEFLDDTGKAMYSLPESSKPR